MPKQIKALRFDTLTFVLNDDPDDERTFSPVNPDAKLVSVSKAIAARKAAEARKVAMNAVDRFAAAVKACAGTVNPYERALKAQLEAERKPAFTIAIKSISDDRRECVGIISRAGVVDRQGDVVDRDALRAAADDLAARVGTQGVVIDRNHLDALDDVALKSVWFGSLAPGVGDDDSLYCRFGFPEGSKTWDAIKSNACHGFSWSGPIAYAQ